MGRLYGLDSSASETHRCLPRLRHVLWHCVLYILRTRYRLSLQCVPWSVSTQLQSTQGKANFSIWQLLVMRGSIRTASIASVAGQSRKQGGLPKRLARTVSAVHLGMLA